jgi:cytochrome c oxidase assembly protein subunit 15
VITQRYIRSPHVISLLTAAATFPLIFLGGLVTSHGAGLSVPDWPNSWGYNMFLFPPRLWRGGIVYEHLHRLMGTVVGMLSIVLTVAAWKLERRRWVRWLCTGVLGAVIFQGVLGGLRVVLVKLDLAIVHACVAQAFFCLAALSAVVTSKWWINATPTDAPGGKPLIAVCATAVITIYLQLIVGATMRHYDAGLAVPDFPLAYGQLFPATDPQSLHRINQERIWKIDLPIVTARQVRLHMGHRLGAVVVAVLVLWACSLIFLRHRSERGLVIPASILTVLIILQITLGVLTVLKRKPADIASAHVAVGALILVTTFILTVRSLRLFANRREPMRRAARAGGEERHSTIENRGSPIDGRPSMLDLPAIGSPRTCRSTAGPLDRN